MSARSDARPEGRRRGCGPVAFLVALVLLLGVAAVLDEVARRAAQQRAANTLKQEIGTSQDVSVHFGGWPFSLALVTGRVKTMHVTSPSLELDHNGSKVTITDVDVLGTGVHDVRHPASAVADHLTVNGTISWAELSQHAGATLTWAGGNRARFTETISVLGTSEKVDVTAVPSINSTTHKVTLTDAKGTVGGVTVPSALLADAATSMAAKIDLPTQQGLDYTGLTVSQQGARATLEGDDVQLESLR